MIPTDKQGDAARVAAIRQAIEAGLRELGEPANGVEDAAQRLTQYVQMLAKWNRTINLTAVTDVFEMVTRHILDSVAIAPWIEGQNVADIGTGPGLPGIPLAVVRPEKQFSLIDSRARRIQFVRQACWDIGVQNVHAVAKRVESYRPPIKFDTLVARAYTSLEGLARSGEAICHENTRIVAMKGRLPTAEIEALPAAIRQSLAVHEIRVPGLVGQRHVVVFGARF